MAGCRWMTRHDRLYSRVVTGDNKMVQSIVRDRQAHKVVAEKVAPLLDLAVACDRHALCSHPLVSFVSQAVHAVVVTVVAAVVVSAAFAPVVLDVHVHALPYHQA